MENLVFVSVQPDIPYFHWQTKVYTHNFIEKGIRPENIHVLFVMTDGKTATEESLKLRERGVNVHHYEDTRPDKRYIPSLRPLALTQWLKQNPELGKCYFYHDADIIFRELPDFTQLLNDDICYLSNTISYIGYDYIKECCKRYESVYRHLPEEHLLDKMCSIIGINKEIIKNNQNNSGGAQYLIKGTDYMFWEKVYNDCITLYNFLSDFHTRHRIQHEIQMWTADMWAVLWNIWYLGKETKITNQMDFSWATDSIEVYESKPILHMAGVTPNFRHNTFYKGDYINVNPLEKLKQNSNYFNYINEKSSTIKYIEVMKNLINNYLL